MMQNRCCCWLLVGVALFPCSGDAQKIIGRKAQSSPQTSTPKVMGVQSSNTRDYDSVLSRRIHAANDIADAAMMRLEEGSDAAAVIVELKRVLALDPSMRHAYLGLGRAYAVEGRRTEALQNYRKYIFSGYGKNWLLSNSSEPRPLAEFALLLSQTRRTREALEIYERARPDTSAYIRFGLPVFGTVYKANEFGAAAHTIIGDVLLLSYRRGQRDRAFAELRKAVALNPNLLIARSRLGQELVTSGKFSEAKPHLEFVVRQGQGEMKHTAASYLTWIKQKSQPNQP